ncbi:MAG TPA: MgtC/SapB family protein [Bryobacteraceae bacterium]|nr:MgtC/SapB family protein [Bryobacteraceae bacterium]
MPDFLNNAPPIWKDLAQLAITYVLTALIGWEREREAHSAGLRTFPLVGIASCGYLLILGAQPNSADQSRVLQGLITGIGFVGGGAILKEGTTVRGTATAASVWNAGVIGASVAMQHYSIAIILALLNLFTLRALLPLKHRIERASDVNAQGEVEAASNKSSLPPQS